MSHSPTQISKLLLKFAGPVLVLLAATASHAGAQQVTVSLGSAAAAPGVSANLSVSITPAGGAQPVIVQWTMTYPAADVSNVTVSAAALATAAEKSVLCANSPGKTVCMLFGVNNNVLSAGIFATATFDISSTAPDASVPVQVTEVEAANAPGDLISGSGVAGAITITQPAPPTLSGFSCAPGSVMAPGTAACTVTLSAAARSGGFAVAVASNNANVTTPGSLMIAAGASSASFTATAGTISISQTATLTASPATIASSATTASDATTAPASTSLVFSLNAVAPTWNISGNISPASSGSGVSVTLSGAATRTATSDGSGNFVFTGLANGAYTVTPSKSGYVFTPANRTVTVNGADAGGVAFAATQIQIQNTRPTIDSKVWKDQGTASLIVTSPTFSTVLGNELLLALIGVDDIAGGQKNKVVDVSGAGLTWVRVNSTGGQGGSAEIWRAFALQPLSNVAITATFAEKSASSITVMTFSGVNTGGTNGSGAIGATGSGSGSSGAPQASLVSSRANALVLGVGIDTKAGIGRTPGTGQSLAHQYLSPDGQTFWVQQQDSLTTSASKSVVINDVAPTTNPYSLSICEIVPPGSKAGSANAAVSEEDAAAESEASNVQYQALPALSNPANGFLGSVCSPGGLASLIGSGLTSQGPQQATAGPLPSQLAGLQVKLNGLPAPLLFVSDAKITFQCPQLPADSHLEINVEDENRASIAAVESTMRAAAPGVYVYDETNQGIVTISGTNEMAMSTVDGIPSRPARRGESISIYANGLGEALDGVAVGLPAPVDRQVALMSKISVLVGGVELDSSFAGLAPGTAGLFQVNAELPAGIPAGPAVPLSVRVTLPDGTVIESNTVTLAIAGEEIL